MNADALRQGTPLLTPAQRQQRLRAIRERPAELDAAHPPSTDSDPDFEAGIAVPVAETTAESTRQRRKD